MLAKAMNSRDGRSRASGNLEPACRGVGDLTVPSVPPHTPRSQMPIVHEIQKSNTAAPNERLTTDDGCPQTALSTNSSAASESDKPTEASRPGSRLAQCPSELSLMSHEVSPPSGPGASSAVFQTTCRDAGDSTIVATPAMEHDRDEEGFVGLSDTNVVSRMGLDMEFQDATSTIEEVVNGPLFVSDLFSSLCPREGDMLSMAWYTDLENQVFPSVGVERRGLSQRREVPETARLYNPMAQSPVDRGRSYFAQASDASSFVIEEDSMSSTTDCSSLLVTSNKQEARAIGSTSRPRPLEPKHATDVPSFLQEDFWHRHRRN